MMIQPQISVVLRLKTNQILPECVLCHRHHLGIGDKVVNRMEDVLVLVEPIF